MSTQKSSFIGPNDPGYDHARSVQATWSRIAQLMSADPVARREAMKSMGRMRTISKEADRISLYSSLLQDPANGSDEGEGGDSKPLPASVFFSYFKPDEEGLHSSRLDLERTRRLSDMLSARSHPATDQSTDSLPSQLATKVNGLVDQQRLLADALQKYNSPSPQEQFETTIAAVKLKLDTTRYEFDLIETFSQELISRLGFDTGASISEDGLIYGTGSQESTMLAMDSLLRGIYFDEIPKDVQEKRHQMSEAAVEKNDGTVSFPVGAKDSLVKAVTDPLMPDKSAISTLCDNLTPDRLCEQDIRLSAKILSQPDPDEVGGSLGPVCAYYNERWREALQDVEGLCEYAKTMGRGDRRC